MLNKIPCRDNNYCLHEVGDIYNELTSGNIYHLKSHVYYGTEYEIITKDYKIYYYRFYDCPGEWALLNDVPIPEQLHIDLYTFIKNHEDEIIHYPNDME